jgi:pimeloyl-ACP methyl ester carboxylesterase
MPTVKTHDIEICYETFGSPAGRPLILIMGLATQMIGWPDPLCRMLADAGHWVIRFDNRDVGLSSHLDGLGLPDLKRFIFARQLAQPPYTLSDMAVDTIGLMDALSIPRAHVCGMSLGGMIGQLMALDWPRRVASLTLLMSTSGEPGLPAATAAASEAMISSPPTDRAAYQDYAAWLYRRFAEGSQAYDESLQRAMAAESFDRGGIYAGGFLRQMAAIMAAPGRRERLAHLRLPTLVMHGDCDSLVPLEHGLDLARTIPGATLAVIKGLGHGLAFPGLWPEMSAAIAQHTAVAAGGAGVA